MIARNTLAKGRGTGERENNETEDKHVVWKGWGVEDERTTLNTICDRFVVRPLLLA